MAYYFNQHNHLPEKIHILLTQINHIKQFHIQDIYSTTLP